MIKTLPLEENPREKAMNYGIETLSNVELLALIIRTGNKSENVLQLAQRILKEAGGIQHLTELNYALLT
jgi:DNA repair protein RadC